MRARNLKPGGSVRTNTWPDCPPWSSVLCRVVVPGRSERLGWTRLHERYFSQKRSNRKPMPVVDPGRCGEGTASCLVREKRTMKNRSDRRLA